MDNDLVNQLREAIRRRGERPSDEQLEEMIRDGVIDREGNVLIRLPEPPWFDNDPREQVKLNPNVCNDPGYPYKISHIGEAAFFHALRELKIVYSNIHQEPWEKWHAGTIGAVEFRGQHWEGDPVELARPNFSAFGVDIQWYKSPGRSMAANRWLTPDEWSEWLEKVIGNLEAVRDKVDQEDCELDHEEED